MSPEALHFLFSQLRERLDGRVPRLAHPMGVELRESAVLAPLLWREGELQLIFTRRPTTLRKHPGQISFPGGARDNADATPLHTALREVEEELGIPVDQVEVLGMLDEQPTPTGFRIQPFLGVISEQAALSPNPAEVAEVLFVPLRQLLDPKRHRTELRHVPLFSQTVTVDFYEASGHVIWGATGRILRNIFELAEGLPAWEALRSP